MRIEVLVDVKTDARRGAAVGRRRAAALFHRQFRLQRLPLHRRRPRGSRLGRAGQDRLDGLAQDRAARCCRSPTASIFSISRPASAQLIVDPEPDKPANRINDGKVDKRGRFVAGSMDTMEEGPNGALYRLDPDLSLHKLDDGIIVSNGPCWSPDGRTFYFADTWSGEIWAYDYDLDTGAVSNRRTFCKVDRSRGGAADGSTVDAEGCLWNAQVYDGKVIRYTPDGKVDRVIDMPVKKVTSVMFGGPNLDVLYVTSMAKPPLPRFPGDGVLRGSLFAIYDLGIRGVPEPRFAG